MLWEFAGSSRAIAGLQRINCGDMPTLVSRAEARTIALLSNRAGGVHMTTRTWAALLTALSICGCATTNSPATAGGPAGPSCLTSTGSRIPAGPGSNCIAAGRSYSQTDLDQTGKTTAAGALANVDPSLTITH